MFRGGDFDKNMPENKGEKGLDKGKQLYYTNYGNYFNVTEPVMTAFP
jgi:hypothetical protein